MDVWSIILGFGLGFLTCHIIVNWPRSIKPNLHPLHPDEPLLFPPPITGTVESTLGPVEEEQEWAITKTERRRASIKQARQRLTMKCKCGEQIFYFEGHAYNAGYSREFPDRPPLRHGCSFLGSEQGYN